MILLTNENAKFLGGKVEKLIRKVKANQVCIFIIESLYYGNNLLLNISFISLPRKSVSFIEKLKRLLSQYFMYQAMIKTSSGDGSSGPPPFIPFQEYIKNNPKVNKQASDNYNAKGSGKSSMESRGNNRPERFQNKNTESSRSKC